MRLWHEALIPYLPRQQLLGQHRECCALRGGGWGKKHATVDYVFEHPYGWLVVYHCLVMDEMEARGYKPYQEWRYGRFHGQSEGYISSENLIDDIFNAQLRTPIYPEHNDAYLDECLENLAGKGIIIRKEDIK